MPAGQTPAAWTRAFGSKHGSLQSRRLGRRPQGIGGMPSCQGHSATRQQNIRVRTHWEALELLIYTPQGPLAPGGHAL